MPRRGRDRVSDPLGGLGHQQRSFNIFHDLIGMPDPFLGSPISNALSLGGGGGGNQISDTQQQQALQQQQAAQQQQQMMMMFAGVGALMVIVIATKGSSGKRR